MHLWPRKEQESIFLLLVGVKEGETQWETDNDVRSWKPSGARRGWGKRGFPPGLNGGSKARRSPRGPGGRGEEEDPPLLFCAFVRSTKVALQSVSLSLSLSLSLSFSFSSLSSSYSSLWVGLELIFPQLFVSQLWKTSFSLFWSFTEIWVRANLENHTNRDGHERCFSAWRRIRERERDRERMCLRKWERGRNVIDSIGWDEKEHVVELSIDNYPNSIRWTQVSLLIKWRLWLHRRGLTG